MEQLYIYPNGQLLEEQQVGIQFPNILLNVRVPLREVMDEIESMLREGYIEVKYSNDERAAPPPPTEHDRSSSLLVRCYGKGPRVLESARRTLIRHAYDESPSHS